MKRTSVQLRTLSIRRIRARPRRRRAPPGFMHRTGEWSGVESRLAQLARFGLAITGQPLLELKAEDA